MGQLGDTMRKGIALTRASKEAGFPCFLSEGGDGGDEVIACALGALFVGHFGDARQALEAYSAIRTVPRHDTYREATDTLFSGLGRLVQHPEKAPNSKLEPMIYVAEDLYEMGGWSRESVADWLDEIYA